MGLLRERSPAPCAPCLFSRYPSSPLHTVVGETSLLTNEIVYLLILKGTQVSKFHEEKATILFLCLPETHMHIHPAIKTHGGIPWCICWYKGSDLVEKKIEEEVAPYLQDNVSDNLTNCCSLCNCLFGWHCSVCMSEMIRLEGLNDGPLLI